MGSGAKARAVTTSMDSGALVHKVFDPQRVNDGGSARHLHGLAQKRRLLADALDQVNFRTFGVRKCAGDDDPGKAGARSEVGPDFSVGGQIQELQRVGDMPRPDHRDVERAIRFVCFCQVDQVLDEAVEPRRCFT